MGAIIRDYSSPLYLLNLKRLSSVFKQTPLKREFAPPNKQTHN
ncbi:hypothetical protein HPHPH45_0122 [Helicobacter pylori Hp H-45]|uniref:Uncharacterized protein n=1 Tax=Helicobacter pylori Hp H-45 TaxID=992050 RepID=J0M6A4_HELPX|nr:hypothetical protein HPHPH45_0122 [Helicobacter pylori Hp H-45]